MTDDEMIELEKAVRAAFPYFFEPYGGDPRIPASFATLRQLLSTHGVAGTPAPLRYRLIGGTDSMDQHHNGNWVQWDDVKHLFPAGVAVPAPSSVQPMTAQRAAYFIERFKHEEKLLGPNEQAACDYVLAMLAAAGVALPAKGGD